MREGQENTGSRVGEYSITQASGVVKITSGAGVFTSICDSGSGLSFCLNLYGHSTGYSGDYEGDLFNVGAAVGVRGKRKN